MHHSINKPSNYAKQSCIYSVLYPTISFQNNVYCYYFTHLPMGAVFVDHNCCISNCDSFADECLKCLI